MSEPIAGTEKRVVSVTGGTGFLGRHLVAELGRNPDRSLRLLSRRDLPVTDMAAHLEPMRGDLLTPESCHRLVTPGGIVVNLAYSAAASRPESLRMAENLASACREAGVARLLHCSTAVVAGRAPEDRVTEATLCRPATEYQRTKLEIEGLLLTELEGRCPVTIIRPTAIFGPGGRNLCKLARELTRGSRLRAGLKASLFAGRRLHLVCVENVVAAIRFLLFDVGDQAGERFIVSDDEAPENNYREVMGLLADELGLRRPGGFPLPSRALLLRLLLRLAGRSDANPRRIYSAQKLAEQGFRGPLELSEGVRRFARWYAGEASGRELGS